MFPNKRKVLTELECRTYTNQNRLYGIKVLLEKNKKQGEVPGEQNFFKNKASFEKELQPCEARTSLD